MRKPNFPLRFTSEGLRGALEKSAQKNHRSLNGEIMHAIEYYLKNAPEAQNNEPVEKEVKTKKSKSP